MKKANKIDLIGPSAAVDFVSHDIFNVPAKIDTGADSSSVWATEVNEENGVLSFVLFDSLSVWYTGEVISTKQYQLSSIKNSFGVAEFRYKVPITVRIGGKQIKARFTLSDRSNNQYPILIGRRTIKNRFVVDVGLTEDDTNKKYRVLMISTKKTPVTQKYAENIASHGKLDVTYISYADLLYETGEGGNKITLLSTGEDVATFDLVYFKTSARYSDVAAAIANYLSVRKRLFIDTALLDCTVSSKLLQYIKLTDQKILVPRSVFLLPDTLAANFHLVKEKLGVPFVLKDIHGNRGEHNYLITSEAEFNTANDELINDGVQAVAQGFIDNDGDFRVLVFGKRIYLVVERTRTNKSTHLNNTSQGASATLIDSSRLPAEVKQDCLKAADLFNREISGVDIVKDKTRDVWYCLEVNDGPQLASGSFVEQKHTGVAEYLYRKIGKYGL